MGGQISVNNPIRRRELRIQYLSKEYVKSHDVKSVLYLAQSKYIVSFNVAKDYVRCAVVLASKTEKLFPNLRDNHE